MYFKLVCFIFLLFAGLNSDAVYAQDVYAIKKYAQASETAIEQRAFNAPEKYSQNARQLTQYLIKPFDNKLDRLRVIAYWMASHISYDGYKYNGKVNKRHIDYHYDVFKARTGICEDFALLFQEMSQYAGVRGVKIETGYVVDTKALRKQYPSHLLKKADGHAWNSIKIGDKVYFIDTTWMAPQKITPKNSSTFNSLSHKLEIKKRSRTTIKKKVTTNINTYYFLFTPQDEVRIHKQQHFPTND